MDERARLDSIRKFGTAGRNVYAHLACAEALVARLTDDGGVVQPDRTRRWTPDELLGRYPDITACDGCGRPFTVGDAGYVSHWITSADELRLWQQLAGESS